MPNIGATGGAVPTGGTSGQVLAKNTGADFDASWAAASSGGGSGGYFPEWKGTNRVFTLPYVPSTLQSQTPNSALGQMAFMQIRIPNACTIAQVGVWNAVNSNVPTYAIGFYADVPPTSSTSPASFGPGARLAWASASLINTQTTYPQGVTLNYTFAASQTVWIAWSFSGTCSLWSVPQASMIQNNPGPMQGYSAGYYAMSTTTPNVGAVMRFNGTYTYSNFPADMTNTSTNLTYTGTPFLPMFYFLLA